ncbi:MAG: glutathione peroxidase [Candidatus Omnitrophica bacterium]|nr:glutathione peroxidase [Candidatus Omnitrophota bacterium]
MKILILGMIGVLMAITPLTAGAQTQNVHSFSMADIDGKEVNLADYKGRALLIVNTASRCGYTKQYAGLEKLYETYKDKGLEVLAFPANNFMGQEPGTNDEIKKFCALKFNTSFPLFAKTSVKGDDINPLYKYLTGASPFQGDITWNFNKFLVDTDGKVVARFDSKTDPMAPEMTAAVENVLPKKE